MPANKLPFFRFSPADYLNDPAVLQMDADAEGCYIRLLARSWQTPTPGVIFFGHVKEMAGGHRLTEQYRLLYDDESGVEVHPFSGLEVLAGRRWDDVLVQLRPAFDTTSRPEFWIQKRMVEEFKHANALAQAQRRGALMTNRSAGGKRPVSGRSAGARRALGAGEVDVEVDLESKTRIKGAAGGEPSPATVKKDDTAPSEPTSPVGASDPPEAGPDGGSSGTHPAPEIGAEESKLAVLSMVGSLAGAKAIPSTDAKKKPKAGPGPHDATWRWLLENASPAEQAVAMRLVGWLMKTGTRDPDALLALTKAFVVYRPENPHAYFTPDGTARQNIATRVASDRAITEHERFKREERDFLAGRS